jgi:myo-inositol-1(or 4)-monophosphatase
MQPLINIALRSIRATNEQIQLILDREELSFTDPEKLKRVITRVDSVFFDDLSKALQRAYPNHIIAKKGDLRGSKGFTWHIMPVHNTTSLARGLPDWCFSVVCKKNDQPEHRTMASACAYPKSVTCS